MSAECNGLPRDRRPGRGTNCGRVAVAAEGFFGFGAAFLVTPALRRA